MTSEIQARENYARFAARAKRRAVLPIGCKWRWSRSPISVPLVKRTR